MEKLQEVLKDPARVPSDAPARCKPCEGGVAALPQQKVQELLARHRGWELIDGKKLTKEFPFSNFMESKYFFDQVALLAEEQGHHPSVTVSYQKVKVSLTTHAAAGLTDNDFIMAGIIDQLSIP
ncbi:MAG: 4a-hydroxytetrahydrobiopterin dehydratase [Candidatus Omnitrophica bacterium]|nr:4a-hydroxytetrahydrobiopterin dehydratase [Candidatus Omnitrophota bacterium]